MRQTQSAKLSVNPFLHLSRAMLAMLALLVGALPLSSDSVYSAQVAEQAVTYC
jgi:hypothetical protein